jgi:hypothetical protein
MARLFVLQKGSATSVQVTIALWLAGALDRRLVAAKAGAPDEERAKGKDGDLGCDEIEFTTRREYDFGITT